MMINALDAPRRQLPEIDYALLWSVLLLLFTGMVMVYSASIAIAEVGRTTGYQPTYYLWRHLAFLVISMMISLATISVRTRVMPRWLTVATYVLALGLLLSIGASPWVVLIFPAWVCAVSIYILLSKLRTRPVNT